MVQVLQIIRWPVVTLIVAMFAILIFRKPVANLLSRVRRVGVGTVNFDAETALAAASNQSESKPVEMAYLPRLPWTQKPRTACIK